MARSSYEGALKKIKLEIELEDEDDDMAYFKLLPEIHKIKLFCILYPYYSKFYVVMHADSYYNKCMQIFKQVTMDKRCSEDQRSIVSKLLEESIKIRSEVKERKFIAIIKQIQNIIMSNL